MTEPKHDSRPPKSASKGMAMRALVIEQDPSALNQICETLEGANCEVRVATSVQNALEQLLQCNPDMLMLNSELAMSGGSELRVWLQASSREQFIPVIFLAPNADAAEHAAAASGIEPACVVSLPVNKTELLTQAANAARLKVAEQKARDQVTIDSPTGLFNRRFFLRHFEDELSSARKHEIPLACARICIDHFASLELIYGKAFVEHLITTVATIVKANTRREDTLARFDDRELAVILTNYDAESSWVYGERIRKSVESHPFEMNGKPLKLTLSVGISCYTSERPGEGIKELIDRAGEALLQAQNIGRNDIVVSVNLEGGESILCW